MFTAEIEKLKLKYTDKYVVVDAQRPELARFADVVGLVKTVNMSGRALVEFQDYHLNIGWYDIDLGFLKVVDKPLPKVKEEKKAPAAPKAAAASPSAKPAAKPGGKASVADILAAARGGAIPGTAAKPPTAKTAAPQPTSGESTAPAGKADRAKMSVADMLAMARGGAKPAQPVGAAPVPPAAEAASPVSEPATAVAPTSAGKVDKSGMSIAQMVAYCREHDAS